MSNIDALANSLEPELPGLAPAEPTNGSFPTDTQQPETQGDDPLEAELGEDGQGDLAPEDEPGAATGDAPRDLRDGTE